MYEKVWVCDEPVSRQVAKNRLVRVGEQSIHQYRAHEVPLLRFKELKTIRVPFQKLEGLPEDGFTL